MSTTSNIFCTKLRMSICQESRLCNGVIYFKARHFPFLRDNRSVVGDSWDLAKCLWRFDLDLDPFTFDLDYAHVKEAELAATLVKII